MSYSFKARGDTKEKVKEAVSAEFDAVADADFDRSLAQGAVFSFIGRLTDPEEGREIVVSVNGIDHQVGGAVLGAGIGIHAEVAFKMPSEE